ncbi:MAG: galactose-1-phosphate uridylyltransferase [Chloroflexota bacterium]
MSELRQDPTTNDWVVFAVERAKRPQHMADKVHHKELPERDESCPFCPGNESRTPEEVYMYPHFAKVSDWQVRVVPNAFPALAMKGGIERREDGPFSHSMDAFGAHEVIIEAPSHNVPMALMSYDQVEQILRAYLNRYIRLGRSRSLKYITIFKNQGPVAGTSLAHPHSQLIATPVASPNYRRNFEFAVKYYDDMGRCLYCDLFLDEREKGVRVVTETKHFFVFHPYASHSPYETWIAPLEHCASFACVKVEEITELAKVLKDTLFSIYQALDNPDFNYMVLTSTTDDTNDPYYHWHIRIIPRLTTIAGFELGSGMSINTVFPEDTAKFMRELANKPEGA